EGKSREGVNTAHGTAAPARSQARQPQPGPSKIHLSRKHESTKYTKEDKRVTAALSSFVPFVLSCFRDSNSGQHPVAAMPHPAWTEPHPAGSLMTLTRLPRPGLHHGLAPAPS